MLDYLSPSHITAEGTVFAPAEIRIALIGAHLSRARRGQEEHREQGKRGTAGERQQL